MNTDREAQKPRRRPSVWPVYVAVAMVVATGMAVLWPVRLTQRPPRLGPPAWDGNIVEVKRLLAAGADVDAQGWLHDGRFTENNATALHFASLGGELEAARALLAAGASVNARTEHGMTPLHLAAQGGDAGTANLLLEQGAAVNARDSWDRTPLHMAAVFDSPAVAMVLVNAGADINAKAGRLGTPLGYARRHDLSEVVELLQECDDTE